VDDSRSVCVLDKGNEMGGIVFGEKDVVFVDRAGRYDLETLTDCGGADGN
jgi:hypothetical protein